MDIGENTFAKVEKIKLKSIFFFASAKLFIGKQSLNDLQIVANYELKTWIKSLHISSTSDIITGHYSTNQRTKLVWDKILINRLGD